MFRNKLIIRRQNREQLSGDFRCVLNEFEC